MKNRLDLRGTPCPVNFVRCKLLLEELGNDQNLEVYLDRGEPEEMVVSGLKNEGYDIQIIFEEIDWIKLLIKVHVV